jgi:hypothetical protein
MKQQQRNRTNNRLIEYGGVIRTLQAWANEIGISHKALSYRLKRWPLDKALTYRSR